MTRRKGEVMKVIIDIPKEVKNRLCFGVTYQEDMQIVCKAFTMAKNSLEAWHNIKARLYAEAKRIDKADNFFTEIWSKAMNKALEIVSYELHKINIEK